MSIVRCVLRSLAYFLIELFVFFFLSFRNSLYILYKSFLRYLLERHFLLVCGLSSHPVDLIFRRAEVVNFNEVQLMTDFFHGPCEERITLSRADIQGGHFRNFSKST